MTTTLEAPPQNLQTEVSKTTASSGGMGWYFGFFFVSGFCSLLYEMIWLRLAMAQFGVTTPMVSIVLSTFMAGLGVGSWFSGHLIRKHAHRFSIPPLQLYAVAEILIGCSAVLVPLELLAGRFLLSHLGKSLSLSSLGYYVVAGIWLAFTLVPWCACMGATIPFGMYAIRRHHRVESSRSFSFLYLANVLGAVAGTIIPLGLVELLGFTGTLQTAMGLNIAICAGAIYLSNKQAPLAVEADTASDEPETSPKFLEKLRSFWNSGTLWLLFATGLTSMGMEVVWTRQFTTFLGTLVYSFAIILGVYLLATFTGSTIYRWWSRRRTSNEPLIWLLVWFAALMPMLACDLRIEVSAWWRVPIGVGLFSGLLGFLTPKLVDRFSEGDPHRAGIAYAVNVAGCILGPLVAGFLLLPHLDERYSLTALALPWLLVGLGFIAAAGRSAAWGAAFTRLIVSAALLAGSVGMIFYTHNYFERLPGAVMLRDNTATVVASGAGMQKRLYVNGVSMTFQTPITKMMASLPLATMDHAPQKALTICFGMGTTHRSLLSWGIDSTAVELVPSVPQFFSYYHADAPQLVKSPRSHIIVDDGRRFLERSQEQYDLIAIDPPPPVGAAGSSLLYSREFYTAAKKHLRPDGILAQWYPGGDNTTTASVALSLKQSFPYVRAFVSFEGWGIQYMASNQPIPFRSPAELARRTPPAAAADLVEWGPNQTAEQQFAALLKNEVPIDKVIDLDSTAPALEDDRPINEYGLLRHTLLKKH